MNKVVNLPKRFSFEYMYRVDGCIFTLEQCAISKMWHLTGYTSREALDACEMPFLQESMELKRHATQFLNFTFKRENWVTETYIQC